MFDRTTSRMDENSRVILVDGAHAVGKTELAKQLASEFDMHYQPYPRMSDYYVNYWGDDLNDYGVYLTDMYKPYDERDWSRNPTGPVEGSGDRQALFLNAKSTTHHSFVATLRGSCGCYRLLLEAKRLGSYPCSQLKIKRVSTTNR